MNKLEFITHLQNNTILSAMYNYFKEKVDVSMEEFMNFLKMQSMQTMNPNAINELMSRFITEHMIKFNVIVVSDKNGNFITYL